MAQFGSVHVWGTWGRRFKSCHLDQIKKRSVRAGRFFHALYRPATTIAEGQLAFLPIDPDFFPTEFLIEKNQKAIATKAMALNIISN